MTGSPIAANYCPEGCYWPCEHRTGTPRGGSDPSEARPVRANSAKPERWRLGPGGGDDPEERALDEWRQWSAAAIEPARGFRALEFCTDCGESFSDAAAHAHEHARRRQLSFDP